MAPVPGAMVLCSANTFFEYRGLYCRNYSWRHKIGTTGFTGGGRSHWDEKFQIFRRITFPLAIRQSLPAYGNEVILMVKSSSLASTITIMDVTGVYKEIASEYFSPLEPLLFAGSIYLLINFIATQIIVYFERRLAI